MGSEKSSSRYGWIASRVCGPPMFNSSAPHVIFSGGDMDAFMGAFLRFRNSPGLNGFGIFAGFEVLVEGHADIPDEKTTQ